MTLNDLDGHSLVAGLFKCNPSNTCAAFYIISTCSCLYGPSALAELLVLIMCVWVCGWETGIQVGDVCDVLLVNVVKLVS